MWITSVSDNCCHHCDGVVYKADAVMDTIHHEDECQTVETSVCRILPGLWLKLLLLLITSLLEGYDKATEETEFSYKNCCNDETGEYLYFTFKSYLLKNIFKGLSSVNSSKLEPKTCSKRHCFYSENLFQSVLISSQVKFISCLHQTFLFPPMVNIQ